MFTYFRQLDIRLTKAAPCKTKIITDAVKTQLKVESVDDMNAVQSIIRQRITAGKAVAFKSSIKKHNDCQVDVRLFRKKGKIDKKLIQFIFLLNLDFK